MLAFDQSRPFLAHLAAACRRRGLAQVETLEGSAEELALPAASLDAAYSRWLFSWLPRPGAALAGVAHALRPGAPFAMQEYLDWATLRVEPAHEAVDWMVGVCMQSWRDGEGEIDVARVLPALAEECGLVPDTPRPVPRSGPVGSPVWHWIDGFFTSYLPRLVERGRVAPGEAERFRAAWSEIAAEGSRTVHGPTLAELVLRKP